jgi:arylsulfatase A-like enzyme
LIDDLGSYDTAVNNEDIAYITPNLHKLSHEGLRLSRFYVYKYCSPTRRSFLSGRYPVHMSGMQAQPCDNTLPKELTLLPQKLKKAATPWFSHFIGKGHLGYPTTDHLPINRGFNSHAGYLAGAEDYDYGFNEGRNPAHDCGGTPKSCIYDFWYDHAPGADVHNQIYYSTNWYTEQAQVLQALLVLLVLLVPPL